MSTKLRQAVAALSEDDRRKPLELCERLLRDGVGDTDPKPLRGLFDDLSLEETRYWISCIYAVLMPQKRRKRLAAYFTPPHITSYVLDLLSSNGVDFFHHTIHDPACGGAAFLAPLTDRLRKAAIAEGWSPHQILSRVESGLSGIEIEPRLAQLAQRVVEDILSAEVHAAGRPLSGIVTIGNSLARTSDDTYDVVVANPPYGRVRSPSARLTARYDAVLSDSHVNTYALFAALSLERVKPGGLVALVIPTSFVGGPYFSNLRRLILSKAEVLSLDIIDRRSDIFLDVIQDTCVLLLKRQDGQAVVQPAPTCAVIGSDGAARYLGEIDIPLDRSGRFWVLPGNASLGSELPFFHPGFRTLTDYGYRVRAGHFVWNRNKEKIIAGQSRRPEHMPLLWASDVRRGQDIWLSANPLLRDHVSLPAAGAAVIRGDAVLLQRTTNRSQDHRLNACVVRTAGQPSPGFVSENHTIVIEPITLGAEKVPIETLALLLNSRAIDERFRRISGTVSVSVKALRTLPLPAPEMLMTALSTTACSDQAVLAALAMSIDESHRETQSSPPPKVSAAALSHP